MTKIRVSTQDAGFRSAPTTTESLQLDCERRLKQLESQGLRRGLPQPSGANCPDFASNDYLGLARHPAVIEAMIQACSQYGVGARAARLISGNSPMHEKLENALAAQKRKERALLFPSGYMAALAAVAPICNSRDDVIFIDHLAHACLIDAAKISQATLRIFHHNDTDHLRKLISKYDGKPGHRLIMTEAVFSMDGDLCPLKELVEIKNSTGAWLLIDEAHATGVIGQKGEGLAVSLGLDNNVDIILGTLGKALGTVGGYLAGPENYIELLLSSARTFLFTTAPPPGICAASLEALRICESAEGDVLRRKLRENLLTAANTLKKSSTPESAIIPLHVGDERKALRIAKELQEKNEIFIPAIRYPTVPRGTARLRITINASLSPEQIRSGLSVVSQTLSSMREG